MTNDERPIVHCFAAFQTSQGEIWGSVLRVSLETAEWMRQVGYVIVGPDPADMIELAKWQRTNPPRYG